MSATLDNGYLCPVCGKQFDPFDKLVDFAIAAHEKDHAPERNNPANMIRYDADSLMWVCKLCGDPLHIGEYTARQAVIGHCREKHGSVTGSSTPVTAGDGHRNSGSWFDGVGEALGDIAGDVIEGIGSVIGKLFD